VDPFARGPTARDLPAPPQNEARKRAEEARGLCRPGVRYSEGMVPARHADDAGAWACRTADVTPEWFPHPSWLHGMSHTQRVHIHARRLVRELNWTEDDARVVLSAALWHDIGRVDDGRDPRHGVRGAARVVELGLHASLSEADAQLALFAIRHHCRDDDHGALRAARQDDPARALRILWLLKDADALDRVRLAPPGAGAFEVDSSMLRHDCTPRMIDFAVELLKAMPQTHTPASTTG
jgi:hypothetical protein